MNNSNRFGERFSVERIGPAPLARGRGGSRGRGDRNERNERTERVAERPERGERSERPDRDNGKFVYFFFKWMILKCWFLNYD